MNDLNPDQTPEPVNQDPEHDFFSDFPEETKETINEILSEQNPKQSDAIKIISFGFLAFFIIGLSFWGSFKIGKKLFSNNTPKQYLREEAYISKKQAIANAQIEKSVTKPKAEILITKTVQQPVKKAALKGSLSKTKAVKTVTSGPEYKVIAGSFSSEKSAAQISAKLNGKGFNAAISQTQVKGKSMYRVIIGQSLSREDAVALKKKAKQSGYDTFLLNQ
ncbi:SPOR domain-containing protein [Candidatus Margulisiibacteriota bacterium]